MKIQAVGTELFHADDTAKLKVDFCSLAKVAKNMFK
jgi:hypothetical protein